MKLTSHVGQHLVALLLRVCDFRRQHVELVLVVLLHDHHALLRQLQLLDEFRFDLDVRLDVVNLRLQFSRLVI